MEKTKPINPVKQPSIEERLDFMEKSFTGLNNVFKLYVVYNDDEKGFRKLLEEKMNQSKKQAEEEMDQVKKQAEVKND